MIEINFSTILIAIFINEQIDFNRFNDIEKVEFNGAQLYEGP